MAANFETKKTTKDKDSIWVEKYQYYFKKPTNKDGIKRYVCSEEGCSASVTIINGDVCKVNGIFIREYNSETKKQAHKDNHEPISDPKIFETDFKLTMKDAIEQQPDKPGIRFSIIVDLVCSDEIVQSARTNSISTD